MLTKTDRFNRTGEWSCRQTPAMNLSIDVGLMTGTTGSLRGFRCGKRVSLCTWRTELFCLCCMGFSSIVLLSGSNEVGITAVDADLHGRRPPTTFRLLHTSCRALEARAFDCE